MSPGSFIINTGYAFSSFTPGQAGYTVIAGNETHHGFANGPALESLFSPYVLSVSQSGHNILFADFYNNCIRKLDRDSGNVTTLMGMCYVTNGQIGSNATMIPGKSIAAELNFFVGPIGIIHLSKRLMYLTYDNTMNIYKLDVLTNQITHLSTTRASSAEIPSINHFLVDPEELYLYVFHKWGLTRVNLDTYDYHLLVGHSDATESTPQITAGSFSEINLGEIYDAFWLVDGRVIVFGDAGQSALGVVDLAAEQVTYLCIG